jgi:c-di-GMP-binding flagellar brake protein YcgR
MPILMNHSLFIIAGVLLMNKIMAIEGDRVRRILATVNLGTAVTINLDGTKENIQAKFVGMEEDVFFLLRFPRRTSISEYLFENNLVKARFVATGKILGFEMAIKAHFFKGNLSFALLEYPTRLETYDARQSRRVKVFVPAELEFSGQAHQGVILDMSAGGVLFSFGQSLESVPAVEEKVNLTFHHFGVHGALRLDCQVKSIRNEQDRTTIGLCYHNLELTMEQEIIKYFDKINDYLDPPTS